MPRLHRALALAALFAVALFPAFALSANVNVSANVAGFGNVQIGSIDVQTGVGGNTDRIDGKFTFDAPFGFLDDWYDFRWINVVTAVTGAASPLFPNGAPAIDPQAPPTNAAEDNEPFYYNTATEWNPNINTQAGPTHTNGVGSTFTDAPQRAAGNGFDFSTYLVARNVTAPGDKKKVGVLAGFTWTYTGTGDASTFGAAIAIGAGDATAINNAIGNAAPANSFPGWSATTDFQLLPCLTPSAWDYVWSTGSQPVVWSPGIWTRDGVEIGRTWPLGIVQPPSTGPSHLSDHITLPAPPNDFHFDVFLPDSGTNISVWYKYPALTPFDFTFPVFTIPEVQQMKLMYDFGTNMLEAINMANMNPFYVGPINGFDPGHFGGQYTGDMRHSMLMGIPEPATFIILLLGCLLVPLRGVVVRQ
jgi:hypothetical protein